MVGFLQIYSVLYYINPKKPKSQQQKIEVTIL